MSSGARHRSENAHWYHSVRASRTLQMRASAGEGGERTRAIPPTSLGRASSALEDQAELVAVRIGHRSPAKAVLVEVCLGPSSSTSERLDPRGGNIDVVHDEVHVNTVLHDLGFWDTL